MNSTLQAVRGGAEIQQARFRPQPGVEKLGRQTSAGLSEFRPDQTSWTTGRIVMKAIRPRRNRPPQLRLQNRVRCVRNDRTGRFTDARTGRMVRTVDCAGVRYVGRIVVKTWGEGKIAQLDLQPLFGASAASVAICGRAGRCGR